MNRNIAEHTGRRLKKKTQYPRVSCLFPGSLIIIPLLLLFCASMSIASTNVGGTISTDTVWGVSGSPYIVTSSVTVIGTNGADGVTTLTIQPGVTVKFNMSKQLTIGASSGNPGALVAEGTAAAPIVFTSAQTTPSAGDWYGISFLNTADDNQCLLSHCDVGYAGNSSSYGAIYVRECTPEISNTRIHHSSSYGIQTYYSSPLIQNCEIDSNNNYGVYITTSCAPNIIGTNFHNNVNYDIYYSSSPTGGNITGNTIRNGIYMVNGTVSSLTGNTIEYNNAKQVQVLANLVGEFLNDNTITGVTSASILQVWGSTITKDATWPATMAIRMRSSITVQGTDGADAVTTLTIGAGATLKFDPSKQLTIGAPSGNPGALVAEGTPESPIVFTSNQPTPAAGDWSGLYYYNTADDDQCVLSYCNVGYAGYSSSFGSIYSHQCNPEISNTRIHHSSSYGIQTYYSSPLIQNCEIDSNNNYGVYITTSCAPNIIGTNFHDNVNYDIYYSSSPTGGNITGNTIRNGIYMVNGTVSSLTGNTIEYNDSKPFYLQANLVGSFFSDNTVTGITSNSIMHVYADTITKDTSWPSTMLYRIRGDVTVQGTDGADGVTTLTIGAGAMLKFDAAKRLTIGATSGGPGALVAEGTAASPIVFTSTQATPAPGDWYGIYFSNTADDSKCVLSHCEVAYAGTSSYGGVHVYESNPEISNTRIHHSSSYGLYASYSDMLVESCEIDNNGTNGVYILYGAPDIIGTDFHDNGTRDIYYQDSPYRGQSYRQYDPRRNQNAERYGFFHNRQHHRIQ